MDFFKLDSNALERSPSVVDGFFSSWDEELEVREAQCIKISGIGAQLSVPQGTIATASVFFHKFFTRHSFREYRSEGRKTLVCAACLFLAGKVEESRRKIEAVLNLPALRELETSDYTKARIRDDIFELERLLLDTIEYRLHVDLPYPILVELVQQQKVSQLRPFENFSESQLKQFAQTAWFFVNDSCKTPVCLIYEARTIAVACLLMGFTFLNPQVDKSCETEWLKAYRVSSKDYADIQFIIMRSLERAIQRGDSRPCSGSRGDSLPNLSLVANPLKRVAPGVGETRNVKQSRSSVSVFSDISESGSSVTLTAASIDADAEEEGQLQASLRHTDFAEDPFENHFVEDVVKVSSEVKKDEKDSFQTVSAVSANSLGPAGLDSSWETNSLIHHNDNPSSERLDATPAPFARVDFESSITTDGRDRPDGDGNGVDAEDLELGLLLRATPCRLGSGSGSGSLRKDGVISEKSE